MTKLYSVLLFCTLMASPIQGKEAPSGGIPSGRGNTGDQSATGDHECPPAIANLRFVGFFNDGAAPVLVGEEPEKQRVGYIGRDGRQIIPAQYFSGKAFSDGLAPVDIGGSSGKLFNKLVPGRYGFIDRSGSVVIQPQFFSARSFSEGMAAVTVGAAELIFGGVATKETSWGFIDKAGEFVIPARFDAVGDFRGGLAWAKVSSNIPRVGFIDKTGNFVIPANFHSSGDFSEGLAAVRLSNKEYDRINKTGWGGKFGFIDTAGRMIVQPQFDVAGPFSEGLAMVGFGVRNTRFGFIDKSGKIVIEPTFSAASSFSQGLAAVKIDKKFGFVDRSGTLAIPAVYDEILTGFREGHPPAEASTSNAITE